MTSREGNKLHQTNKLNIYLESNGIAWFTASTFCADQAAVL